VQAQTANPASTPFKGDDPARRVHRFEANAAPITFSDKKVPLQLSLPQLMNAYKIPGLSAQPKKSQRN
jgi:hypothetical protein